MNTRKTWSAIALAIISMNFCIFYGECALEAVEAASVRGNHSFGDGIWRADDFGWFYYDLDKDTGGEELLIRDVWGRTAERGDVVYSSKRWSKDYEFASWGSYDVAALFGRLFCRLSG